MTVPANTSEIWGDEEFAYDRLIPNFVKILRLKHDNKAIGFHLKNQVGCRVLAAEQGKRERGRERERERGREREREGEREREHMLRLLITIYP